MELKSFVSYSVNGLVGSFNRTAYGIEIVQSGIPV